MHALSQGLSNAGNGLQIGQTRVLDAFSSTEMAQKRLHFFGTEPLDGLQRIFHRASSSAFAVEAVDKPVGFVTCVDEDTTASIQHQGTMSFPVAGFLAFCQRGHVEPAPHLCLLQGPLDRVEVGLSAIEQKQVRPFILAFEPPLNDLLHHTKVVHGVAFDRVGAVLLLGRTTVSQHDACPDPFLALQLRHVETDDVIQPFEAQQHGAFIGSPLLQTS